MKPSLWNKYVLLKGMLNKFDYTVSAGYEFAEENSNLEEKRLVNNINKNIFCQISLEQRMACGVGACMGCSVKLTTEDVNYARVCKDGPVYWGNEVVWDD